jgi:hypothetical protein
MRSRRSRNFVRRTGFLLRDPYCVPPGRLLNGFRSRTRDNSFGRASCCVVGGVAAGAVAGAALGLLPAISPWSGAGVSTVTFKVGTGIYLVIVAAMSSSVGGYLAARLRTKWVGIHSHEVFFRDAANGFLAWAFATLLSASALGPVTAYLPNGATAVSAAVSQATRSANPAEIHVDKLFRTAAGVKPAVVPDTNTLNQSRAEMRLWTASFRNNKDLSAADRTYVAQVVAALTGLRHDDAEKRVNDVVAEANIDARRGAAKAFVLAHRSHVVWCIRRRPSSGRRWLASRRHLERPRSHPSATIRSTSWAEAFYFGCLASPSRSSFFWRSSYTEDRTSRYKRRNHTVCIASMPLVAIA